MNDIVDDGYVPKDTILDENGRDVIVTAVLQYGKYKNKLFAVKVAGEYSSLSWLDVNDGAYVFRSLYKIPNGDMICAIASNDSTSYVSFAT